jgi:hypothetical protein
MRLRARRDLVVPILGLEGRISAGEYLLTETSTKFSGRGRAAELAEAGRESCPTRARLDRLSSDEAAVYDDLVSDRLGDCVRLEQERIDWAWAEPRFPLS